MGLPHREQAGRVAVIEQGSLVVENPLGEGIEALFVRELWPRAP
jgi:hypothetical protein